MSASPRIDAVLGQLAAEGRELSDRSCPQALVDEARRIEGELGQVMAIFVRLKSTYETESRGAQNAMRMIRDSLSVDDGSEVLDAIGSLKDRIKRLGEAFSYAVNGASAAFDAAGIPPGEFVDRAKAAMDRIKRMEQLGDDMANADSNYALACAVNQWRKSKEAKP